MSEGTGTGGNVIGKRTEGKGRETGGNVRRKRDRRQCQREESICSDTFLSSSGLKPSSRGMALTNLFYFTSWMRIKGYVVTRQCH
jgi:hypothetical protein